MPVNYKDYLAANVLSEGKIVNYRMLSRALSVHVNVAKQYLYDFYQAQQARKHDSVHATYLLSGRRRYEERSEPPKTNGQANGQVNEGQANVPASSPFPSSVPQEEDGKAEFDLTAISIVREEDLEEAKAKLNEIIAIHIYSLERATFQNLQTLSDCNREISLALAEEDVDAGQFGIISNPLVKKRQTRVAHVQRDVRQTQTSDSHTKVERHGSDSTTSTQDVQSKATADSPFQPKKPSSQTKKATTSRKTDTKPPTLNRDNSDLFKSFAKAKTKSKEVKQRASEIPSVTRESTEQSASEDETMLDTFEASEEGSSSSEHESAIDVNDEGRIERQSKLQKMMEDDDESMDGTEKTEYEQEPAETTENAKSLDEQSDDQTQVTVSGGRRRGRRRVMKKRTIKDEEGYLVTKEELIWESFSEEEPERKMVSSAPSTQNSKKSGSKPGQGKIMSFFSKK